MSDKSVTRPTDQELANLREQVVEPMSWGETIADGRLGVAAADALLDRYVAAELRRVLAPIWALVEEWDTDADARYGANRIAKSTAARVLRDALPPADGDQS